WTIGWIGRDFLVAGNATGCDCGFGISVVNEEVISCVEISKWFFTSRWFSIVTAGRSITCWVTCSVTCSITCSTIGGSDLRVFVSSLRRGSGGDGFAGKEIAFAGFHITGCFKGWG